jgi:hypothetical protein
VSERISTDKFLHNKDEKTFTAEASDLPTGWINGVTLVSPRKTTAHFFLADTVRDPREGEIKAWIFKCSTNEKVKDYRMVIFND